MSRSKWKGFFIDNSIYKFISKKRLEKKGESKNDPVIMVRSRRSTVLKDFIGKDVWIHTGKFFTKKKIKEQMVGHKFGEFAFTRAKFVFRKTKKK